MYVLSGYAQCQLEGNQTFKKGARHHIGFFTVDNNFDEDFLPLKKFAKSLGWDSIVITHIEYIIDCEGILNSTLINGFQRANQNGQSLIVEDHPIQLH